MMYYQHRTVRYKPCHDLIDILGAFSRL